jgi:hypothetical protein
MRPSALALHTTPSLQKERQLSYLLAFAYNHRDVMRYGG